MKTAYMLLILFLSLIAVNYSQEFPDEIIFYSNGSTFSPIIYVQGEAAILWTFNDNSTSSLTNPTKNYGVNQIRMNRLKVTPWNALIGINIGCKGDKFGADTVSYQPGQEVSKVEHLDLAAPYLLSWYSSQNMIDTLIFNNFISLEILECNNSTTFKHISLDNTQNLKQISVEEDSLQTLDLSESIAIREIRASLNVLTAMNLPDGITQLNHICFRDNPQLTSPFLFNNMENFPLVSELFIGRTNQSGTLAIHQTFSNSISFMATENYYTSIDFSGAFQNPSGRAEIHLQNNFINSINIEGCKQIKYLDLTTNNLSSDSVDKVLQQLDAFGTMNGLIDLRENAIPTSTGIMHASNLIAKNWTVLTESTTFINEDSTFTPLDFELSQNYPNPFNPETNIKYQIPNDSKVIIKIYNILGSEVEELVNETKKAGVYEINFNAENLSSGIYLYRLQVENSSPNSTQSFVEIKKMTLLK